MREPLAHAGEPERIAQRYGPAGPRRTKGGPATPPYALMADVSPAAGNAPP